MNIRKLRGMLDSRVISAAELTKFFLSRIETWDQNIGAFLHVNEHALEAAEKAQKRIDAGDPQPLTGIPLGLKDNLCTTDMPTTCASKMLEHYRPPYDAAVVAKLRAQDAVFLGKLNMDEFAMGATTQTSYYQKTRNPFDESRVPGGSSGGSAAAVSAGLCAAALGSDTGGSIRQPASFCGVTGHRPTYGAVSRYGCVAFASSLDQIGPIAACAADCELLLQAVAGRDEHDQTSFRADQRNRVRNRVRNRSEIKTNAASLQGVKLGLIEELLGENVAEETRRAVLHAAAWYENAGAVVETVSLPALDYAVPAYYLISSAEASANLSRFDGVRYGHRTEKPAHYEELIAKTRAEGFGWEVKRRVLLGSYALCSGYYDDYYMKAVRLAGALREQYARAFETYDALLSPASPTAAFPKDNIPDDPAQLYLADVCTVSAPLAGLPSLSTPCGYTAKGLPIGLMITGARWADHWILSLADCFEQSFDRRDPPMAAEMQKEGGL
ncbi:MAG: Asp-tRNA(Asn)/Glu-tRNA(Gln) amidotransferase subunit GatA [Clostridiales bacterium]|jgi:aspartyl-tRNA(Asn)/glutamyl-tRNA(Gln) amidotransferase subunit A|nr:Asp-tRNA(Asn)/Glu-tRNA(Gln) amidotransferase subunit GatA [Clostridiales bacterium]